MSKKIFTYTHKDKFGVLWRFEGGRPISILADQVMADMEWPTEPQEAVQLGYPLKRNVKTNKSAKEDSKHARRGTAKPKTNH